MNVEFQIILGSVMLLLGVSAGVIMHRSDYCMSGAFRDLFLFRSTFMLRVLLLQIAFSALLFELVRQLGVAGLPPFGPPLLGNVLGGIVFGFGMVIAGGCVVGTLYKMGAGNLPSMVAVIGLIVGSGVYAEVHPYLKAITAVSLGTGAATLPLALGLPQWIVAVVFIAILALIYFNWSHKGLMYREAHAKAYLQPGRAALYLSLLVCISLVLSGMPFGIATTYMKIVSGIEQLFIPEHVAGVALFNGPSFPIETPWGETIVMAAGPVMDTMTLFQGPLILGIVGGSFVSALSLGEFAVSGNVPAKQFVFAFVGGVLMAVGARVGFGCNVWHVMGGLPFLGLKGLLFVAGLFPGAFLASRVVSNWLISCQLGREVNG